MHYILMEAAEAAQNTVNLWIPVIIQSIVTAGAVFGGAEYWKWRQVKLQSQNKSSSDTSNNTKAIEDKVDNVSKDLSTLGNKVDDLSDDMKDLKRDIAILQEANQETLRYRQLRDEADKSDSAERHAIIVSLCGMMRERLLDNYKRCIKKGYYTKEEREIYGEMFTCYENPPFNGDGVMHDLRPIMKALPWSADSIGPQHEDYDDD